MSSRLKTDPFRFSLGGLKQIATHVAPLAIAHDRLRHGCVHGPYSGRCRAMSGADGSPRRECCMHETTPAAR